MNMNMPVIGFALCACFVVYVLIGYPVALDIFARLFPQPIRKAFSPRAVSVIVPVRNGAEWIVPKLNSLVASRYPAELLDILVVSDGSSDDTNTLVSAYSHGRIRLLELPPSGKATAVSKALSLVQGEIVVLTDVRQTFDPEAIQLLVSCFADEAVGVVTGELVIREGNSQEEFHTGLYWKYEKWIRRKSEPDRRHAGRHGFHLRYSA